MFTIAKTTTPAPNNCTAIKPNYKWENYTGDDTLGMFGKGSTSMQRSEGNTNFIQ
jgi:hypothetical protein